MKGYDLEHHSVIDYIRQEQDESNNNNKIGIGRQTYSELITAFQNAVFDQRIKMQIKHSPHRNIGSTAVTAFDTSILEGGVKMPKSSPLFVDAICLDDLLPHLQPKRPVYLKMRIEGSEARALFCAARFFAEADVRVVLLDVMYHRTEEQRKIFSEFFTNFGYSLYHGDTYSALEISKVKEWPFNVYWVKTDEEARQIFKYIITPQKKPKQAPQEVNENENDNDNGHGRLTLEQIFGIRKPRF